MFTLKVTIFCFMWLIHRLHILFADKSIILSLAKLPLSFPIHMLTIYHKAPTNQDSITQRAEDEICASLRLDTRQDLVGRWKARPEGSLLVAERGCPQALPSCPVNGQFSGRILVWVLCGNTSVLHGCDCLGGLQV